MKNKKIIYQQIKNATVKITYHKITFLVVHIGSGCFPVAPKPEKKNKKSIKCSSNSYK